METFKQHLDKFININDEEFTSVTVTHWMPITPENPEINKG